MSIRVLVVEDDEGDAFLMESLLTELREISASSAAPRFEPTTASSLASAAEALRSGSYSAVILDLDIPGSRGTEGLAALLADAPDVPVVAVSADSDLELGIRAVSSGAQDHIVKSELAGSRLARAVLYAMERHRQSASLRERTIVDELTGLYNRRGFFTLGEQTLLLMRRRGRELAVVFVDLDGLKRVNDTYGHERGDELIRGAAALLRATFRDSDIVARIGGDEFAVVAHETDGRSTAMIMGRLKAALAKHNAPLPVEHRLSMSVGAVHRTAVEGAELSELLAEADSEMYAEKRRRHVAAPGR
jgi:two-component system, cell cycle response regulator